MNPQLIPSVVLFLLMGVVAFFVGRASLGAWRLWRRVADTPTGATLTYKRGDDLFLVSDQGERTVVAGLRSKALTGAIAALLFAAIAIGLPAFALLY